MTAVEEPLNLALHQPGSAGPLTQRYGVIFLLLILAMSITVVVFGHTPLAKLPQFTIFHSSFLFAVDGVVAFLLLAQFAFHRLTAYAILGFAYLLNALLMIPFLLSFPGALGTGSLIGGSQSSVWVWHIWHLLFPLMVIWAVLVQERNAQINGRVSHTIAWAVGAAIGVTLLVTLMITVYHHALPVLITNMRIPLTRAFYVVGSVAALATTIAFVLTLWLARRHSMLHFWLALALAAFMGDMAASLSAMERYTMGWYFSRVGSMLAAGMLLLVMLNEILRLYHRLGAAHVALKGQEEKIRHLAYFDPVTDLPNRRLLMDRLKQDLSQAKRHGYCLALLFLDLDEFKQVNDRHGHEIGDKLLHEVALRVSRCVRSGDTVSRLGGDEFVIVLPEVNHVRDAEATAVKVLAELREPMIIDHHPIVVTSSIGIAMVTPDTQADASALLGRADAAMYCAKNAGRNRYVVEELRSDDGGASLNQA